MAYICNECRRVSAVRCSNCPGCGYSLKEDNRPLEEFIRLGYREIGKKRSAQSPQPNQSAPTSGTSTGTEGFTIDDNDYLNRLRRSFKNEPGPITPQTPIPPPIKVAPQPTPQQTDSRTTTLGSPFFDLGPIDPLPTPEPPPVTQEEGGLYMEPEMQPRFETRRRPRRSSGHFWYSVRIFMAMIPWRLIFTLLIIVAIIAVVMFVWGMRYTILESVLGFLIELLPLGLLIGGVIYLIRCIFR